MGPSGATAFCAILVCTLLMTVDRSSCQQTSSVTCPLDVTFVVDHSGSISDNDEGPLPNWSYVIELMTYVVQSMYNSSQSPSGVRFAAVSFGSQASVEFTLDQYSTSADTVRAVSSISNSGGNTNTTGALRTARLGVLSSSGNRPTAQDIIVLITDGVPSRRYEADGLMAEVDLLKRNGVIIIGVGVTTAVNDSLMLQIVSDPASDYFDVMSFGQLKSIFNDLTSCISYRTTSTINTATGTSTVTINGTVTGTISSSTSTSVTSTSGSSSTTTSTVSTSTSTTRSTTSTVTGSTTTSTTGSTVSGLTPSSTSPTTPSGTRSTAAPATGCRQGFDLIILLDASGGGTNNNQQFEAVKQYLINLVSHMEIGDDLVRVGLMKFADSQTPIFNLNTYIGNIDGMTAAIQKVSITGGGTNTGSG